MIHFETFGEVYFSVVNPGAVKACRPHRVTTSLLAVPVGTIRLVLFDERQSSTRGQISSVEIGESNYVLVRVPLRCGRGCVPSESGLQFSPTVRPRRIGPMTSGDAREMIRATHMTGRDDSGHWQQLHGVRAMVTGASAFPGTHLCRALVVQGASVHALRRRATDSTPATGFRMSIGTSRICV